MLALALSCDFEILFLKRPCLILCLLDSGVTLGGLGLDWPIEYCCVEEVPVPMVRMCVCVCLCTMAQMWKSKRTFYLLPMCVPRIGSHSEPSDLSASTFIL